MTGNPWENSGTTKEKRQWKDRTRQQLQKEQRERERKEQRERERKEQEAPTKSEYENMKETTAWIKKTVDGIVEGTPTAFAELLSCVRLLSEVAVYILDNMETRNTEEAEPAPEVKE